MDYSHLLVLDGLFKIWEKNGFDLDFYFKEIFDKALDLLQQKAASLRPGLLDGEEPRYKALLIPVGFRIENFALMAALFKPDNLTPIFSAATRNFHRRRSSFIEGKIKEHCPNVVIEHVPPVAQDDHRHMEAKVVTWWEKMRQGYGYPNDRIAIDLTGGTKPMTVGAQNGARSLNVPAFYLSVDYDEDSLQAIPGTEMLLEMPMGQAQTDDKLVFVMMPFASEFDAVNQAMQEAVEGINFRYLRADQEIYLGGVMDKVKENIAKGGLLIAELTNQNPNVYYELGLAHAWKKKVIIISQTMDSIPFDLKHLNVLIYDPANLDKLKKDLQQRIEIISKEVSVP